MSIRATTRLVAGRFTEPAASPPEVAGRFIEPSFRNLLCIGFRLGGSRFRHALYRSLGLALRNPLRSRVNHLRDPEAEHEHRLTGLHLVGAETSLSDKLSTSW